MITKAPTTPASDELRRIIAQSNLTRYKIAQRSGLEQAALSRFVTGKRGLWSGSLDRLTPVLGLKLVSTVEENEVDGSRPTVNGSGTWERTVTYPFPVVRQSAVELSPISVELRRIIMESGMIPDEIAKRCGIVPRVLRQFLAGERELWTGTLDPLFDVLELTIIATREEEAGVDGRRRAASEDGIVRLPLPDVRKAA